MINNKNILAITLARGGSKSVPRKNIKQINGKPLIAYTIEEALKSSYIDDYIVSTDDQEIKIVAEKYKANVPFLRPSELSEDQSSSSSALIHAVNFMEEHNSCKYDFIIELMCTNPLKNRFDIDSIIEKAYSTNAESVIAVHKLDDHHPARIKKIENDKIIDFCVPEPNEARRQDLTPLAYIRSGSIYCMRRDFLMDKGMRYGGEDSRPYILPDERAVNIDTLNDFRLADLIIEKRVS
jgi:CMP-N,N'-diacetyllegionaminic acid synthase